MVYLTITRKTTIKSYLDLASWTPESRKKIIFKHTHIWRMKKKKKDMPVTVWTQKIKKHAFAFHVSGLMGCMPVFFSRF